MAAPAEIGKYRILSELGRGAMGAVYLAEDPFIARRVAIKVMRPQVEEGAERFLQEARTIGSLSHPNIVLLHDFGFVGELPYLVMEHVEGTILDRWLAEPHEPQARLRVLAGLCRAVLYAHSRGVLHRDLKPSNVLVRSDGEAKLLDFGIARVENTRLTATGVVLGTPEYLAPELLGSGGFSPRSDMYALGLVAYELFGGRNPFAADTVAACLRRVLEVAPAPLAADSPAPAEVAAEVMRCLAKNPLHRPESPEQLLAATERALAAGLAPAPGPAMATSPTTRMATGANRPRPARRTRQLAGVAAAAVVAAGLGVAGYRLLAPAAAPQEPARGEKAIVPDRTARDPTAPVPAAIPEVAAVAPPGASAPPTVSPVAAPGPKPATAPASPKVSPQPHPSDQVAGPVAGPTAAAQPRAAGLDESPPAPAATENPPAKDSAVAEPAAPESKPPSVLVEPAPAAAPGLAPAAVPPALPHLTSIAPQTLRRGAGATVRLRSDTIPEGWNVQLRRGGKIATQIRVLRSKRTGPGELEISLLPEEDAPIGTYSLVLVSPSGMVTNALSFEVDL